MTPEIWIGIGMACAIGMIYAGLHWDKKKKEDAAAERRAERDQEAHDRVVREARERIRIREDKEFDDRAKAVSEDRKAKHKEKRIRQENMRDDREDIGGISMTDAILAATLLDENSSPASHDTAPACTPEPSSLHTSTSYDTGSSFSSGGGSDFGGGGGGDSGGGGGGCGGSD